MSVLNIQRNFGQLLNPLSATKEDIIDVAAAFLMHDLLLKKHPTYLKNKKGLYIGYDTLVDDIAIKNTLGEFNPKLAKRLLFKELDKIYDYLFKDTLQRRALEKILRTHQKIALLKFVYNTGLKHFVKSELEHAYLQCEFTNMVHIMRNNYVDDKINNACIKIFSKKTLPSTTTDDVFWIGFTLVVVLILGIAIYYGLTHGYLPT